MNLIERHIEQEFVNASAIKKGISRKGVISVSYLYRRITPPP